MSNQNYISDQELVNYMNHLENGGHEEILERMERINNPPRRFGNFLDLVSSPLPSFVEKGKGFCPNWILPVDDFEMGFEIECMDSNNVFNGVIGSYHSRGSDIVPVEFLPSFNGKKWKVEYDGSLGCDGVEIISPILKGSEGISNMVESLEILRRKGFSVNSRCGLHYHFGLKSICKNSKVDDVVSFLSRLNQSVLNYQGGLFGSQGSRRDRNQYCPPFSPSENLINYSMEVMEKGKGNKSFSDFRNLYGSSRKYRILNISKLSGGIDGENSSIEFRYPSGSLSEKKFLLNLVIMVWVIRQSWVDRHNRKGSDSISWEMKKGFQKESNKRKEGILSYQFLSRKIKNSIRGKWLKYENEYLYKNWDSIFSE